MVARLRAVHRWAVTGTPIKSGVPDLHPLFSFLGMHPLSDKALWRSAVEVGQRPQSPLPPLQPQLCADWPGNPCPPRDSVPCAQRPILSGVGAPAEHLRSLFRTHAWRNTKESVADQLALPRLVRCGPCHLSAGLRYRSASHPTKPVCPSRQAVVRHPVELSGVERSFYEQQARESGRHVLAELDRFAAEHERGAPRGGAWRELDPDTVLPDRVAMRVRRSTAGQGLGSPPPPSARPWRPCFLTQAGTVPTPQLKPLMQTLRLACCHPQLALQRRSGSAKTSSRVLEIQECLRRMIRDAKVACEEHLRSCTFARNAQAGILMLLARYGDAADCYRGTLRLADEHARLDRLALLHTCHNAAEALEKAGRPSPEAGADAAGEGQGKQASGRQLRASPHEVAERCWEPEALRGYTALLRREVLFQAAARVDAAAVETRRAMAAFRERGKVAGLMSRAYFLPHGGGGLWQGHSAPPFLLLPRHPAPVQPRGGRGRWRWSRRSRRAHSWTNTAAWWRNTTAERGRARTQLPRRCWPRWTP